MGAVRARRSGWAREYLFSVIEGEPLPAPRLPARRQAISDTAMRLATKLRGTDRATLASWLNATGFRERAVRMMRSPLALRRAMGTRLFVAALADRETGPLIELLRDRDARVRAAAARALGECGLDTAVPFLVRATRSTSTPLPVSVAAMAILHTAPRSARGLGMAWEAPEPGVTAMATDVAGFLHLTDARPRIEAVLLAREPDVAMSAALALVRLGDPRSGDVLQRRLERDDLPEAARRALHQAYAELHDVRLER